MKEETKSKLVALLAGAIVTLLIGLIETYL